MTKTLVGMPTSSACVQTSRVAPTPFAKQPTPQAQCSIGTDVRETLTVVHISGADGVETIVEPPRAQQGTCPLQPVRLVPGDRLLLAGTTEFVIVALPES